MTQDPDREPGDDEEIDDDAVRPVLVFRGAQGRPVPVPQDVVEENDAIYRAHQLKLEGLTWVEIAKRVGFPSSTAAKAAVDGYLKEARFLMALETSKEMLANEIEYLYHLQSKLAAGVNVGDVQAIKAGLAISTKRVEWLNLAVQDDRNLAAVTVVQPGDDYVKYLEGVVAARQQGQTVPSTVSTSPEEDS